jgi:AcrR family transcriptional regulator
VSARGPDVARTRPARALAAGTDAARTRPTRPARSTRSATARAPSADAPRARSARAATAERHPPSRNPPAAVTRIGPRNEFIEAQRRRLLSTLVQAVAEVGYLQLSVTLIVSRAGVSRKTFYELFGNLEDAFLAAFDDAVAEIGASTVEAYSQPGAWEERVRAGLEAVLGLLDEEPTLARLCVVESPRVGPRVLERRAEIIEALARVLDGGRRGAGSRRGGGPPPLTAHSLVAGALSVVHDRLLAPRPAPLTELVGPLMSMIVFPYRGPAAAARELRRPARSAGRRPARSPRVNPLGDLGTRLTYRTIRVLDFIAEHPGANNREIAAGAGVADQGQISKLLIRLASFGLIENAETSGKGFANAWLVTPKGEEIRHAVKI